MHLHGQTGRFTVWANGKRNSGLVNFIRESRLPFHLPENDCEGLKPVFEDGFEEI